MTKYIDLHAHSTYSIQDGMGSPKQVVERAVELGWEAACLTEHGWMGSAFSFYKECKKAGIKPILGCELYIVPDDILGINNKDTRKSSFHLTVLALSLEGYQNIVAWNNYSMRRENFYYKPRISLGAMLETAPHSLHHNVVLSGCIGGELCQFLLEANGSSLSIAANYVEGLRQAFPNFYIELQNHRIEKFVGRGFDAYDSLLENERNLQRGLIAVAEHCNVDVIITNDSHLQSVKQRKAHIAMRAQQWRHRDDSHYGSSDESEVIGFMKDYTYFGNVMRDMEKVADGLPREGLDNIAEIVREANIVLEPLDSWNYSIPNCGFKDATQRLRDISKNRLKKAKIRHGRVAIERFNFELESMGEFANYLVLMADFISKARKQGILTNTRGSAANSFLAYCVGIHDVDSIEYGLIFSRFFNPARKKFPDIDIDIEKDRHDDFMQIVYGHMATLEGEGQVVPMCNLGTAANRSAFRQAASALGMPKEKQDELAKLLPQMIDSGMVDDEIDAYEALQDDYPELYALASTMFDSVKSVGQHACAYLFGTKDRPIEEWVPLYFISSSGTLVTQYDKGALKEFGLVKGDFLRLRTLSVIKRTLTLLGKSPLELENIPLDDAKTFEMLREGRTEGVFTLQGKENRRGCTQVKPNNVHDVIASVAIYRPALTRTGLDKIFCNRRFGRESVDYPHDLAEKILAPTYGVPIFQEQVMELGYAVGMDDDAIADLLEAIATAKGVGRGAAEKLAELKPLFTKAAKKVMSKDERREYWKFIEGSQGYGFNKGHATSYGILAVRSAYLKANHPAEFFTALLDVYPEKHKYIAAARSEGFHFLPPCINQSSAGFSLDRATGQIRVGLSRVFGLGPVAVNEIVSQQPFVSLDDFKDRTSGRAVNSRRIETLIRIGAMASVGIENSPIDDDQLEIVGFTFKKPKTLRKLKPKYTAERKSQGWVHRGREKGAELTEGRVSVSKLFWIPEASTLELKASAWAQIKTWLMLAVDENGIPYHIMVPEDREWDAKVLKYIHKNLRGHAICLDGGIRQPYLNDGPLGFRFYGVTGSFKDDAQIFYNPKGTTVDDRKINSVISGGLRAKRMKVAA